MQEDRRVTMATGLRRSYGIPRDTARQVLYIYHQVEAPIIQLGHQAGPARRQHVTAVEDDSVAHAGPSLTRI